MISNAGKLGLQIISARSMFESEMPSKINLLFIVKDFYRWVQGVEDQDFPEDCRVNGHEHHN